MRPLQRTAVGMLGVAATVLLHSLLFAIAMWGNPFSRAPKQPDAVGAGANSGRADGETGERRIIVILNAEIDNQHSDIARALLAEPVMNRATIIEVTGLNSLPPPRVEFDELGDALAPTNAELMAQTKLAGIYESQIRARIERAWTLPPQPDAAGASCRVQVHQLPDGRIDEIALELEQCKGSAEWQQSVSNAVFLASPLPAPPHPSVFVDRFTLDLRTEDAWNWNQIAKR